MKKIAFTILIMLAVLTASEAQELRNLNIGNPQIELVDSSVKLTIDLEADRKTVRNGVTVVYIPQISDGINRVCFAPAIIRGKGSQVAWERHAWASGNMGKYEDAVHIKPGSRVTYQAEEPFQEWMRGAALESEYLIAGCCSTTTGRFQFVSDILPAVRPEPEEIPVPEDAPEPELTLADEIAGVFPFVLPVSEFDPENPVRFYDDERENDIIIYFHINRYDIDTRYADNQQTLMNLIAAIEMIRESVEAEVSRVVVAGFASPEGPFELNDRLAWERAVSVKEYIMKNSGLTDELISVYNGSADWQGLRLLVASDRTMPGREEVLGIIDNVSVWDSETNTGRNTRLRQLQDGVPYRYMAEHIFPKLRNGAFIRVYYYNN